MPSIYISPEIFSRLESHARGFNDKPANVIARLLDFHDAHQQCPCGAAPMVRRPSTRNNSLYEFEGDRYKKGPLVHAVVAAHVRDNPEIKYAELCKDFPEELQGNYGVVRKIEEVLRWQDPHRRFFMDKPIIEMADGSTVVVCSQWGDSGTLRNFPRFLKAAEKLGYHVTQVAR